MVPGIFQRAFGGQKSTLEADLKRITESGVIELPKELLDVVVEAALGEDDRRLIMRHLRECLAEPTVRRWRRVYAALALIEDLAKRGPPELLVETANGHHFDLVQRLSLLERFENTGDRRVQNMVRTKATALRTEMVTRLQAAGDEAPLQGGDAIKDTASTCSPGITSDAGSSSTSPSGTSGGAPPARPEGRMILNGIVAVGHSDDTTDEEDSDDGGVRKAVSYKQQRKERKAPARRADNSSDSENDGRARPPVEKAAPPPAPIVDLLEL